MAHPRTIYTGKRLVIYKNTGKTPAVVTKTRLGCDAFHKPPIPQSAPVTEVPSGAVIPADEPWVRGRIGVTDEMRAKAKEVSGAIYLYGEITYLDIFDNEHSTWFCRRWTGKKFVLDTLTDRKYNGRN